MEHCVSRYSESLFGGPEFIYDVDSTRLYLGDQAVKTNHNRSIVRMEAARLDGEYLSRKDFLGKVPLRGDTTSTSRQQFPCLGRARMFMDVWSIERMALLL